MPIPLTCIRVAQAHQVCAEGCLGTQLLWCACYCAVTLDVNSPILKPVCEKNDMNEDDLSVPEMGGDKGNG